MAVVEGGASVVQCRIQGVRWNIGGPGGVGVRIVKDVVAKQRNHAHADVGIHDELLLLEDAFGLELIQDFVGGRKAGSIRVNKICIKLVIAAGIEISHGNIGRFGKLPLEAHTGLYGVRSAQI